MFRVLDLFSGIGGFSLGLKRTGGFRTVCYVEIEPYCQEVLKARMQDGALDMAPIWDDVTKFEGESWRGQVDLICGGFPCQDISIAGRGIGITGERSGLWGDYARIIGEVRPRYVIVENVSALLARGLGDVLGDLAESGYDAEWDCIPASAVGAPHQRDRVWIVAYATGVGRYIGRGVQRQHEDHLVKERETQKDQQSGGVGKRRTRQGSEVMADAKQQRLQGISGKGVPGTWGASVQSPRSGAKVVNPKCFGHLRPQDEVRAGRDAPVDAGWWISEPDVGRVAHGVPKRVDRLKALGNAVVPQVVEWIGRRILESL